MKSRSIFCSTRWDKVFPATLTCTAYIDDDDDDDANDGNSSSVLDRLSAFVQADVDIMKKDPSNSANSHAIIASGTLDIALDAIHIFPAEEQQQQQAAPSSPAAAASRRFTIEYNDVRAFIRHTAISYQRRTSGSTLSLNDQPVVRPAVQLLLSSGHCLVLVADPPPPNHRSTDAKAAAALALNTQFAAKALLGSAAVLWRRAHGLASALERALLRSHPIDEALFLVSTSLPLELFATMDVTSSLQQLQQQQQQKKRPGGNNSATTSSSSGSPTRAAAVATGVDATTGSSAAGGGSSSSAGGLLAIASTITSNSSGPGGTAATSEKTVRIEVSVDGVLSITLLPKDTSTMKEYETLLASGGSSSTSASSQDLLLLHRCELSRCVDIRADANNSGTVFIVLPAPSSTSSSAAAASAAGGGGGNNGGALQTLTVHLHSSSSSNSSSSSSSSNVSGEERAVSLPDLYCSLSIARVWALQPGRFAEFIPGAVQPFNRTELRALSACYLSLQQQLRTIWLNNNVKRSPAAAQIGTSADGTPLLALCLADVGLIYVNLISKNSEASHDVFLRNLLEVLMTAQYTEWGAAREAPHLDPKSHFLTFADFAFAMHLLERGGVNARLLFFYGAVLRTFFHRGGKVFDLSVFKRFMRTLSTLMHMTGLWAASSPSSSGSENASTSTAALLLGISPGASPLLKQQPQSDLYHQSVSNNASFHGGAMDGGGGNNNSTTEAALIAAAASGGGFNSPHVIKLVEAQAEQLWRVALAIYGDDDFENNTDPFSQFLGLIKISKELKVSALQHLYAVMQNPATTTTGAGAAISPSSLAVHPGANKFLTTTLLYLGFNLAAAAAANNNMEQDADLPDSAFESPGESPRGGGHHNNNDDAAGDPFSSTRGQQQHHQHQQRLHQQQGADGSFPTINLDELKPVPEKTIYDLSRSRVKLSQTTEDTTTVVEKVTRAISIRETGAFFTAYAGGIFREVRKVFGVSEATVWRAVSSQSIKARMCFGSWAGCKFMSTSGRSKSLFLRSSDSSLIFKELPKHEVTVLRKTLPHYLEHVTAYPNTLLPRYLGLYKLAMRSGEGEDYSYVVVMQSALCGAERTVSELFDLKGSSVGRSVVEGASDLLGAASKDVEFVGGSGGGGRGRPVALPAAFRTALLRQLHCDVSFLRSINLTDYSLLLAVCRADDTEVEAASHYGERGHIIGGQQVIIPSAAAPAPAVSALDAADDQDGDYASSPPRPRSNTLLAEEEEEESLLLEPCPVRRCVNYCISKKQQYHYHHPQQQQSQQRYFSTFFGGIPAFDRARYVDDKDVACGIEGWPAAPAQMPRRFPKTHGVFEQEDMTEEQLAAEVQQQEAGIQPPAATATAGEKSQTEEAEAAAFTAEERVRQRELRKRKQHPNRLREIVIVSLIDTLTTYDWRKKMETAAKTALLKQMKEVSCAPADFYAARFLNFCSTSVFVPAVEMDV